MSRKSLEELNAERVQRARDMKRAKEIDDALAREGQECPVCGAEHCFVGTSRGPFLCRCDTVLERREDGSIGLAAANDASSE